MKRKITKITALILSVLFSLSSLVTTAFATGYTAMIVQGNTPDVGDCKVFFEQLKRVPGNNSYTIDNCGWHYNSGNSYHNWSRTSTQNDLADAQDLINAGLYDVLYWSGHGGRVRLNVHGSNDYGPGSAKQPTIYMPSTLKVDSSNWASTSLWNKSSNLKVAIFAACQVLDNTSGDCKYLVRLMKASNIRVIAGYHQVSPTNPTDTDIAEAFFANSRNGGVTGGESIRSSWQTANELKGESGSWAVLCYKDGYNQYYRIPGFPGNTYSAPSSSATVYRFWSQYTDSTGGQPMTTSANSEGAALPLEITVIPSIDTQASNNRDLTVYREMNDACQSTIDENSQRLIAESYLSEKHRDGLEAIGTVYCEEMDEDIGAVPGTETVIGKTFCYMNQYNGIKLLNNFYKVATDADGVYCVIDKWRDIAVPSEEAMNNPAILSADAICNLADSFGEEDSENAGLVYVPINESTSRLCYEITHADGDTTYLDAATGEGVEVFYI